MLEFLITRTVNGFALYINSRLVCEAESVSKLLAESKQEGFEINTSFFTNDIYTVNLLCNS